MKNNFDSIELMNLVIKMQQIGMRKCYIYRIKKIQPQTEHVDVV